MPSIVNCLSQWSLSCFPFNISESSARMIQETGRDVRTCKAPDKNLYNSPYHNRDASMFECSPLLFATSDGQQKTCFEPQDRKLHITQDKGRWRSKLCKQTVFVLQSQQLKCKMTRLGNLQHSSSIISEIVPWGVNSLCWIWSGGRIVWISSPGLGDYDSEKSTSQKLTFTSWNRLWLVTHPSELFSPFVRFHNQGPNPPWPSPK